MSSFFVTASGTDIGKTFVTAGLVRHLTAAGTKACAIKPVLSGFDPSNAAESDAGVLLAAQNQDVTSENIDKISPWRYTAALAPNMAARRENKTVDLESIVRFSAAEIEKYSEDNSGVLFVEGVGGVMAPVTDTHTVLDWLEALMIPSILVAGSYLGSISHALTALRTIQARGLETPVVVISESENPAVPLEESMESFLGLAGSVRCLALPRASDAHGPAFAALAQILLDNNADR